MAKALKGLIPKEDTPVVTNLMDRNSASYGIWGQHFKQWETLHIYSYCKHKITNYSKIQEHSFIAEAKCQVAQALFTTAWLFFFSSSFLK